VLSALLLGANSMGALDLPQTPGPRRCNLFKLQAVWPLPIEELRSILAKVSRKRVREGGRRKQMFHTYGVCLAKRRLIGKPRGRIIETQPKSLFAPSEGPWAFCLPGGLFAGRPEAPLVITNGAKRSEESRSCRGARRTTEAGRHGNFEILRS